jgi:hypothetical protein
MATSDVIASLALVVSVLSAAVTFYFHFRDRPDLILKSQFVSSYDPGTERIAISIVNAGRRPAILRMWAGEDTAGHWVGSYLGEGKAGLRLGENEHFEFSLPKQELQASTPDSEVEFIDIWVEDSLGKRHQVKDAKANIARLRYAKEI